MSWRITIAMAVAMLTVCAAAAKAPESLDSLRQQADGANGGHKAELCIEVAHRDLEDANRLYGAGDSDKGRAAIEESARYAELAGQAATESGKRLKQTEIALRKLSARMQDVKRSLSFEDRGPLDNAIQKTEQARGKILDRMFQK